MADASFSASLILWFFIIYTSSWRRAKVSVPRDVPSGVVQQKIVASASHLASAAFFRTGVLCRACGEPLGHAPQEVSPLARRLASPSMLSLPASAWHRMTAPSSPASFLHRSAWFIVAFEALGFISQFVFAAGKRHRRRGRNLGFGELSASPNRRRYLASPGDSPLLRAPLAYRNSACRPGDAPCHRRSANALRRLPAAVMPSARSQRRLALPRCCSEPVASASRSSFVSARGRHRRRAAPCSALTSRSASPGHCFAADKLSASPGGRFVDSALLAPLDFARLLLRAYHVARQLRGCWQTSSTSRSPLFGPDEPFGVVWPSLGRWRALGVAWRSLCRQRAFWRRSASRSCCCEPVASHGSFSRPLAVVLDAARLYAGLGEPSGVARPSSRRWQDLRLARRFLRHQRATQRRWASSCCCCERLASRGSFVAAGVRRRPRTAFFLALASH